MMTAMEGDRKLAGLVARLDANASPQFGGGRGFLFEIVAELDWPTMDEWVWLDGYQLPSPGQWTRTGTPPKVTVTPSIGQGGQGPDGGAPWSYHAFARDGFLEDVE